MRNGKRADKISDLPARMRAVAVMLAAGATNREGLVSMHDDDRDEAGNG